MKTGPALNKNAIRFLQMLSKSDKYDTYQSLSLVGVNVCYLENEELIYKKDGHWYLTDKGKNLLMEKNSNES